MDGKEEKSGEFECPIEPFKESFWELQKEAQANGVKSVVILFYDDALESAEEFYMGHVGAGATIALGMLERSKQRITDKYKLDD